MASTPPRTPKSKPRFLSCPDTQPRFPLTTQPQYLSGDLTEGRRAVVNDINRYREVPYDQLVGSRLHPLPTDSKVAQIRQVLRTRGAITQDDKEWTRFVQRPSAAQRSECVVFQPLQSTISTIFEQVDMTLFRFVVAPTETPISTRRNTSRPDAYIRLKTWYRSDRKTHWFDIAIPFEFKKSKNDDEKRDNERKVIWSLHNIMREDPLRRFALGITIEDTELRIWHIDRALLTVSTSIDFTADIDRVISLFCLIAQQTKVDLGWDPTVERTADERYVFMICGKRYTTTRELATFGADLTISRATRVYEAVDEETKEKVAIKDSWRESSRDHEGSILENLHRDIERKLGKEEAAEAKKYIVGVRAYEDVQVLDKLDETLNPGKDGRWIEINGEPRFSGTPHLPSIGHIPASDYLPSKSLRRVPLPMKNEDGTIPRRVHARIVFNDVGLPVKDVTVLNDCMSCLFDALKGLLYVHLGGWVHRDVSVSNVLWVEDKDKPGHFTGKLADFEYAKEIVSDDSHEVRTGTMHFMAIEVELQRYNYLPPAQFSLESAVTAVKLFSGLRSAFRMNPLHDLESIWWDLTWIMFYHTDKNSPTEKAEHQLCFFNQAFPGAIGQASRQNFFEKGEVLDAAYKTLSTTYGKKSETIWQLAVVLRKYYEKVEGDPSGLPMEEKLTRAAHKHASDAFSVAIANLEEMRIHLQPLQRPVKRNVDDSPSDQARKKAKQALPMSV
ncbi:hypothetical protein JVT61DRAFT_12266 [Boletus reticuloceps]|uniref:Protein kinase domain-containing protein n=1 Tax=Boletus reticuloceps TaxID=495285 RepID=A0A8I3A3A8_9AGAM|nr:hypothetical protein JVT61DRAFT_12266 [Boletus reticuloceps]